MSDLDPLFPRHGNSGPAPEVTPLIPTGARWLADQVTVTYSNPFGSRSVTILPGWVAAPWLEVIEQQHPEALR